MIVSLFNVSIRESRSLFIGMDVDGGHASVEELRKAGNMNASVHVVPKAGHHVYLDNPEATNRILDEAIKALPRVGEVD